MPIFILLSFLLLNSINAQSHKVVESTSDHLIIEFDFSNKYKVEKKNFDEKTFTIVSGENFPLKQPGEPSLPEYNLNFSIPHNAEAEIKIIDLKTEKFSDVFILPVPDSANQTLENLYYKKDIYQYNQFYPKVPAQLSDPFITRYLKISSLCIAPYQFNPVARELIFNKKFIVRIDFKINSNLIIQKVEDRVSEEYASSLLNSIEAKAFIGTPLKLSKTNEESYWYNPQKNYYKIYLNKKGIYRISYEYLLSAGVPIGENTENNKLELINLGEKIPIDIFDNNNDGFFNSGDYFQFAGYPPRSTDPYTFYNIYTSENIYWFSYQNSDEPIRYIDRNGYPSEWENTYVSNLATIHYEEDKIFERLGYAKNNERDFWFWDKASAQSGTILNRFTGIFPSFQNYIPDSHVVKLKVNMHGMTLGGDCGINHKAYISLTDQPVGEAVWKDQEAFTFEKDFYVSEDSIRIFPTGNRMQVVVKGDACPSLNSDEIRINWFEFEYWKENRTSENNFDFTFDLRYGGINRYWLFGWQRDNMKIYIPQKRKIISNPYIVNDEYNSVLFVDTLLERTEYFCVSEDYFLLPDSINKDEISADLRNISNGADYIIITHPDFLEAAERLGQYRSENLSGYTSPRIKVIDVREIYDEFSYGLLNPGALKDFIKYTFDNWEKPAPLYIVLFGDMSHDYRGITNSDHKNFIPSLMYYAQSFGTVVSDNLLVAVSGEDISPDLVIGRLPAESIEDANILVDKIINYPADPGKNWKEDVLLLASGLSEEDQRDFNFNGQAKLLESRYLIPNGINGSKVFNYPDPRIPEDFQYKGSGPRMREEFNEGAVIANYYGHGGGGQWDLVFTNDDIEELEANNKLPLVLSVTCYTAHFDDQDAFGENFLRIPDKGAIGFWGSTALTYWGAGTSINQRLYHHIFNNKNYVVGKAILNAKSDIIGFSDMIAQLSYLGDPAIELAIPKSPDFEVRNSSIAISPEFPLKDDTVIVSVRITNLGITFPNDSVSVRLFKNNNDPQNLIGEIYEQNFGQEKILEFKWVPGEEGLYNFIVEVNSEGRLNETDLSDNTASSAFSVFNISEPNIIYPIDGYSTARTSVNFLLADISETINKNLSYFFEIDTSTTFTSPIIKSEPVFPADGTVKWVANNLTMDRVYFWRVRISDGESFGNWSKIRSFSLIDNPLNGYLAFDNILKLFDTYNINFSETDKTLSLNSSLLPPRPSDENFIEDIIPNTSVLDSIYLTSIATDGTYIYFGNIWYYAQNFNSSGNSFIYKIGTGNNGTTKGEYYGIVPNFYDRISMQIFYHSDGFLYIPTGNPHYLKRINPETGDTSSVYIPDGLLTWDTAKPENGSFYITSDGQYVYNLTLRDSLQNSIYILRTFDPSNNWNLVKPDIALTSSFQGFSGFFAADGYIYPYENYFSGYMRKIRASDGFFDEEWINFRPFQSYYAWCWDWQNNKVYASVYRTNFTPKISSFGGRYVDATGNIFSSVIGPAYNWSSISYNLENNNSSNIVDNYLLGLNVVNNKWDTLVTNIPSTFSLDEVDEQNYKYLQLSFTITDSSFSSVNPVKLKSIHVDYSEFPEVILSGKKIIVNPDSTLQGFPVDINVSVKNAGKSEIDSVRVSLFLNDADSAFTVRVISLKSDSSFDFSEKIETTGIIFNNKIRAILSLPSDDLFTFNNIAEKSFYISRDSINPVFSITADGEEIIEGDIISANPEIVISLKDDSPLPLDTSHFTIAYFHEDNFQLINFNNPDVEYSYTPYPNSEMIIKWKPLLKDGEHSLSILARDASGNFFDTTTYQITFYVFNEPDLLNVFNYPNPFQSDTYFTFELHGIKVPDEFYIKIYTVAGRLIRDLKVSPDQLKIGLLNRVYWDGRDEDGDEVANGVYFYKIVAKINDIIKTRTEKLAKVK